jgi:hypothetical protein
MSALVLAISRRLLKQSVHFHLFGGVAVHWRQTVWRWE